METFRQIILKSINVPIGRISFRVDKWGTVCTIYFHGKFNPVSICDDTMTTDDINQFLHYVKHGSDAMIEAAKETYGENWRKYIKHRG